MSQSPRDDSPFVTPAQSANIVYALLSAHAMCFYPFLRASFGAEGLGFVAVFALLLQLVCIVASGDPALLYFLGAWFVALIIQRFITFSDWFKGRRVHSEYEGYPVVTRIMFPYINDERQLRTMELFGCVAVAVPFCATQSDSLANFILSGVVTLPLKHGIETYVRHRRMQQLEDAEIEHDLLLAEWDERRNRWS